MGPWIRCRLIDTAEQAAQMGSTPVAPADGSAAFRSGPAPARLLWPAAGYCREANSQVLVAGHGWETAGPL